jgi:predicted protein tyrosine phosphatase
MTSKFTLEEIAKLDSAFISITGSRIYAIEKRAWEEDAKVFAQPKLPSNVIALQFDDIIPGDPVCNLPGYVLFNDNHAIELAKFIRDNEDKSQWIIHCKAGISRSGAVGVVINDYFELDYFRFKANNPIVQPNSHIVGLLRKALKI